MATAFPFVQVPRGAELMVGLPDEGSRIYRRFGQEAESALWFDALFEFIGPVVSPGGAAMYARVSRAAVNKRLKAGNLTAFCFHVETTRRTLLGNKRKLKELPFVFIPVSECKAWAEDIQQRSDRQKTGEDPVTPEDLDHTFLARPKPRKQ